MIAYFGNCERCTRSCITGGTCSNDTTMDGTWYSWEGEISTSLIRVEKLKIDKDYRKLKNAIKATKTMVAIGKAYTSRLRTIFIATKNYLRRMMFCLSGHLPWRLRRLIGR